MLRHPDTDTSNENNNIAITISSTVCNRISYSSNYLRELRSSLLWKSVTIDDCAVDRINDLGIRRVVLSRGRRARLRVRQRLSDITGRAAILAFSSIALQPASLLHPSCPGCRVLRTLGSLKQVALLLAAIQPHGFVNPASRPACLPRLIVARLRLLQLRRRSRRHACPTSLQPRLPPPTSRCRPVSTTVSGAVVG